MFDAEQEQNFEPKKQEILEKLAFFGSGNNSKLAKDALVLEGFKVMPYGMQFSDTYRFKWV